jgi:FAD/FMN-containing dehydrogenase
LSSHLAAISVPTLRAELDGQVLGPDDGGYDQARTIFWGGFDQRPGAIVRPADESGVARVVALARDSGLELAVRSGGHSPAGHSLSDGGIVLDLSRLRVLDIDPDQRTAWAQAGLTAGAYTTATAAHGLGTGFGDTGSVGIGGLTLSGGVGYLVRKHGLTIDSLLAASWSPPTASCCGSTSRPTRSCSGRSAAAAATSAWRPASTTGCTRSTRSSAACCSCRRRPR